MNNKRFHFFVPFVVSFLLFCLAGTTPAVAQAVTLTTTNDIDIGTVEAPVGGTETVTIAPNGSIICSGGMLCPATGVAGRLQFTGPVGRDARFSCEATKTMRNVGGVGGNQDQTATPFVIHHVGSGTRATCTGTGNGNEVIREAISANPANNVILVGMQMNIDNPRLGGQYALSNHTSGQFVVRMRVAGSGGATVTSDVDATSTVLGVLELINNVPTDLGEIEVTAPPVAGSRVDLGTNGNRAFAGNFNGSGPGTAGRITLTGATNGETIEVFCTQTATLTNAAGSASIDITGVEVSVQALLGNYGAAFPCNGLATPAMVGPYQSGTQDTVYLGGRLDGATASGTISGNFSTSNTGGSAVQVILVRP